MTPEVRKYASFVEDTLIEGFKTANPPLRMAAVAAVLKNPWSGRFVEDLRPEIHAFAPVLGREMVERLMPLVGDGDAVEAFGKSAIVGGEVEHGSALIHTLRFGNFFCVMLYEAANSSRFQTSVAGPEIRSPCRSSTSRKVVRGVDKTRKGIH